MSATVGGALVVFLWLMALAMWLVQRRMPDARPGAPGLSALERARRAVGRGLLVITSIVYLGTTLRYAFAVPQHMTPTEGWLHVILWNAIASAYVEMGILYRYLERSGYRRAGANPAG